MRLWRLSKEWGESGKSLRPQAPASRTIQKRFLEGISEGRSRIVAVLTRSPMEKDRRRSPRYPFVGSIEMREGTSEDKRIARVKELSLNGCYVMRKALIRWGRHWR